MATLSEDCIGHINSITIEDGNGVVKNYSGMMIDKDNRLILKQKNIVIKYGIETGEVEFFPYFKKSKTQTKVI